MYYLIATLYIIFIFSLIAALTCLAIVPLFFVIKHLKSKYWVNSVWLTDKKTKIILASITIIFAAFQTYTAFYPTDSFYESEFSDNTNIGFPDNAKILVKGSTYPDIHGDYSASAIIHIDEPTIKKLRENIRSNKNFKKDSRPFLFGNDIRENSKEFNEKLFTDNYYWNLTEDGTYYFNIAFDTMNNLVAFDRVTW
jgi:hypothetical protein